jgi:hypothetical protein
MGRVENLCRRVKTQVCRERGRRKARACFREMRENCVLTPNMELGVEIGELGELRVVVLHLFDMMEWEDSGGNVKWEHILQKSVI